MSETIGTPSAAAPSAASPSTTATPSAPSPPASATATPAPTPSHAPSAPAEPGPVPYARFKEINEQLRAARDFQDQYGWASGFSRDPYAFVESWVDQLAAHPQYQSQILAKAARLLQSRRGQTVPQADMPTPDIPVRDDAGNVVAMTYSDKQLQARDAWVWQEREAALAERLHPLEQMRAQFEQQAALADIHERADAHAKATLGELRQDPYFTAHEAEIKRAFADHPEWGDNLDRAYRYVLTQSVIPKLAQTEQGRVLESLHTKAAAATVSPGTQTASQKPRFRNFEEALRYFDSHPDEAAAVAQQA